MIPDKALHDKCICGATIHMKFSLDELTDRERSNYTKQKQYFINKRNIFHSNNNTEHREDKFMPSYMNNY